MLVIAKNLDEFIQNILNGLPEGKLYSHVKTPNSNLFTFYKGLKKILYQYLAQEQDYINDLIINTSNPEIINKLINKWAIEYNLVGNFTLENTNDKTLNLALLFFIRLKLAITKEEIIQIFADYGYNVTIVNRADTLTTPTYADKFTLLVSVNIVSSQPNSQYNVALYGTGLYFNPNSNIVRNILRKLFPCYICIVFS